MIRAEMSSIMRDFNAHYSLRIRDTPRQASTFWMPDLCRRPNLTVPVLRLTVPASHSCSSPRSLSIIRLESHHSSVRTQLCWCRRRRCCHLQKKWHIPFLKATGFFSPFQEFVFFYKWLSAPVTQHDTTENVFDIIQLLAVKQWRFIHPLFWGRISFSSIWRSG